jgi:hypothetical protein
MASSALDQSGNFAIAYNVSSTSTFPSLRYSGRLVDDALGTLTQGDNSIIEGTASNSSNRYGDYAAMGVDPADDCTFWFTGMNNNSSNWRTQVASFAFDACGCELRPSPLTVGSQVSGDNVIDLSWDDADLATVVEYTIHRSRTEGGPYDLIATVPDTSPGIAGGPDTFYSDTDVSGGTTYYYIVRASDGESCKSEESNETSATATGACTLTPLFGGIQNVVAPQLNNCTLDLYWTAAQEECGGPITYNIYRSTSSFFTPGASNLITSGITTTVYSDFDQLVNGGIYFYIVRAFDQGSGKEDENNVILPGQPQGASGACTTVSSCSDNPFIDVQPDGSSLACSASGFALTAVPNGGTDPFTYQWTKDGIDIPGATASTYVPTGLGTHSYNVKVQSTRCPSFVFDGLDSEVTLVNRPFFDGVREVVNPQTLDCSLDVQWDAGTTVCDGPVRYFVYRDSVSPVAATADNLIAAGVLDTHYTDQAEQTNATTQYYLVRAQDASTGQFETNSVEASAFPDGPGSGPQAVLDEDFSNTASFAAWTVTTGPGPHTCGEWAIGDAAANRPSGGSGSYGIANSQCHPILGRTSSTLTSPAVDVDLANLVSVTLELDMWFNHNGGEDGTIEVYDGSGWVTIWADSNSDFNGHKSFDVTPWAAGNSNFQVRFDYQFATDDRWFAIDNVQVIALTDVQCAATPAGPPAAPDGSGVTDPLRADRATVAGDTINVTWDSGSCPAADYNLLYGDLADVASATLAGSECALGSSGSYSWNAVPPGDLFFLVVGTDGAGTESSWGYDGYGGERNSIGASGECAIWFKETSNSCP